MVGAYAGHSMDHVITHTPVATIQLREASNAFESLFHEISSTKISLKPFVRIHNYWSKINKPHRTGGLPKRLQSVLA
jgi:hypothetical protein